MEQRTVTVTIRQGVGGSPLLLHADNIEFKDYVESWIKQPGNKKKSTPGDDRTPPWTWIGCLNNDTEHVIVPSEYIMACLLQSGSQLVLKKQTTYKSLTQSGIMIPDAFGWKLCVGGKPIKWAPIKAMLDQDLTFADHNRVVAEMGFDLLVKRASVNKTTKHVRVRPIFRDWSITGSVCLIDDQMTPEVLQQLLDYGGRYKGIGDWRPGSPKSPGQFGRFESKVF